MRKNKNLNLLSVEKVEDVKSYANAIMAEKDYLEAYAQFGKDHPMTNKHRIVLDQAVQDFEKQDRNYMAV
jgi:hypothetical protein